LQASGSLLPFGARSGHWVSLYGVRIHYPPKIFLSRLGILEAMLTAATGSVKLRLA